jgi:hypothetical protein
MQYRLNSKTVFRHGGVAGSTIVATLILVPVAASALHSVTNGNTVGAAVSAVCLWLIWQGGLWSKVVISQRGITIDSFFVRRQISWEQLSGIGADGGLRFQLEDGTEVGTMIYGGSLIGALTQYRGIRRTRDKMLTACNRYRAMITDGELSHHHEHRLQLRAAWWVLLVYIALFESIAITADLANHAR